MTNNVPRVVVSASGSGLRRALAPPPGIRLVCLLRRAAAALPCFLLLAPAAPRSVSSRLVSCLCLCLGLAVRRLPAVCRRVERAHGKSCVRSQCAERGVDHLCGPRRSSGVLRAWCTYNTNSLGTKGDLWSVRFRPQPDVADLSKFLVVVEARSCE